MAMQSLLTMQSWKRAQDLRADLDSGLTAVQCDVLLVVSPLTVLLEQKYGLKLDVALHEQYVGKASVAEAALLRVGDVEACLRRRVSLLFCDEVMFDAESVLPLSGIPPVLMAELEAGQRPLANVLSDRGLALSRSALSVAKIESEGCYHHCWARRSVLAAESGAKALVTEVFYDALWQKLDRGC